MKKTQTSQTARATAAVRAIESEKPADARICYDPFARKFTEMWFYLLIKLFAGYGERRSHRELTFIVCRCRYFDDYLQRCLQSGTAQVVILGAGLTRVQTQRNYVSAVLSRISGERRDFGIEQSQIEDFLTRRGFTHVMSVNAEQLQRLYCTGPNQGRTVAENYAIVHAQVGESQV